MANIPHTVSLLPTTWLFPCKYRSGAINRLKQSFFFFFRFTVSIDCVFFFFVVALQAPYLLFFKSCTWSFLNFFFNVFFSFDFVDPHVTQYKSYLTWLIYEVRNSEGLAYLITSFLRRKVWLFSQRDFRRTAVRGDIMWESLITSQRGCICSGNCLKMSFI